MIKKAHVPPSKKKYNEAHPVVSFRASREDYEALKKVLGTSGKSIGQFFREALGTAQRDTKIAYKQGRKDGFKLGFDKAKEHYRVVIPCARCGKWIPVFGKDRQLKLANSILTRKVWLHRKCWMPKWPEDQCVLFD